MATDGMDAEMKEFIEIETQKAQFYEQAMTVTDICWAKCVDKIGSKTIGNGGDSRTETCLTNCVERFIETSLLVVQNWNAKAS
jgi:import inner membrane translocase subunit TIM8